MQNSTMMTLDCKQYLYPLKIERLKIKQKSLKASNKLRHSIYYNSFCSYLSRYADYFTKERLEGLCGDKPYEVDLLKDSYLRSIVILTLREPLGEGGNFATFFYRGIILETLSK